MSVPTQTELSFFLRKKASVYGLVQYNYLQYFSHYDCIAEVMGVQLGARQDWRMDACKAIVATLLGKQG